MISYPQPKSSCPYCGYKMDASTPLNDTYSPKPGDLSLCISCAEMLIFDDNLWLRKPTNEELDSFKTDEMKFALVLKAQELIREYKLAKQA